MSTADLRDQDFLGGGVHVGHNGYTVVVWLEDEGAYGPGAIAMEPAVLARLVTYRKRVLSRVA